MLLCLSSVDAISWELFSFARSLPRGLELELGSVSDMRYKCNVPAKWTWREVKWSD